MIHMVVARLYQFSPFYYRVNRHNLTKVTLNATERGEKVSNWVVSGFGIRNIGPSPGQERTHIIIR